MVDPTDQSSREQELSPCPFCGASDLDPAKQGKQYVACNNCGAFGPSPDSSYPLMQWDLRRAEIHDAWNARAALSTPPLAITAEEAGREGEAHVPYLCIAPVCGGHCGDCAYAIGPQEQRDYALRYAHLRTMQQSGCGVFEFQGNGEPNPNGILLGGHLDSFVDAELSAMKLPPAPAQSGGQG